VATTYSVSVVTLEESVYEGEAELVIARSPDGELYILGSDLTLRMRR
jgi:F0F1-type ATP synthase epsilon subunit